MYDEPTHAYMRELRDELDRYLKDPSMDTGSFLTLRLGDLHYVLEQQDRERRLARRLAADRRRGVGAVRLSASIDGGRATG